MFENTPSAFCPVCGDRVPACSMKYACTDGAVCTEVYACAVCGTRFYVETGVLTEDD